MKKLFAKFALLAKYIPAAKLKKFGPWIIFAIFALIIGMSFRPTKKVGGFDVAAFGSLPVLLNGRVQPFDSVARNTLLQVHNKSAVKLEDEDRNPEDIRYKRKKLSSTEWIMEVMFEPETADTRKIFYIVHPQLQSELGFPQGEEKLFSFNDIIERRTDDGKGAANLIQLEKERDRLANIDEELWEPYDKQVARLHKALGFYVRLRNAVRPADTDRLFQGGFDEELETFESAMPAGLAVAHSGGMPQNEEDRRALQMLSIFFTRYQELERNSWPLVLPPLDVKEDPHGWVNLGKGLMESMPRGEMHPIITKFAAMADAFRNDEPGKFNSEVQDYHAWLQGNGLAKAESKGGTEFFFNKFAPFYQSMTLYVVALVLTFVYWLNFSGWLRSSGMKLAILAFAIHTIGLIFRMALEGRPPVTNLYSSAVFVGWGAAGLGLILERIFRGGIGLAVSSVVGFTTLIIAHHLSLSGDTMEMLQAVLDTNFWLATHVVVITLGYASMFVGGFLAIVYILRGFFSTGLDSDTARALTRMVYGILCFSTLFSFVGTILGGIWADQSWGRFWGWDPKENGALMIVIWCAAVLHARWGGIIKERGLMACAIFGNIVTAYSWFGVNMLGIGLHSYGFMDKAFFWLMFFNATQLLLLVPCFFPSQYWRSFAKATPPPVPRKQPAMAEA